MEIGAELRRIPQNRKVVAIGFGLILTASGMALAQNQEGQKVEAVAIKSNSPAVPDLGRCALKDGSQNSECSYERMDPATTTTTTSTTIPPTTTTTLRIAQEHAARSGKRMVVAQANSAPQASSSGLCEQYRSLVEKYTDWPVDAVLFTGSKESGCNPNDHSPTNDYGWLQIHDDPSALDPATAVAIAHDQKWAPYHNFSQWYAVCTRNTHRPIYDFPGLNCQ